MGLRLREGVDRTRFADQWDDRLYNNINGLVDMGMIAVDAERLWITPEGRPVLNAVLRQLLEG
jgi:oxygen-independent coproporphyrinogen-3 oxidase